MPAPAPTTDATAGPVRPTAVGPDAHLDPAVEPARPVPAPGRTDRLSALLEVRAAAPTSGSSPVPVAVRAGRDPGRTGELA